MPLCLAGASGAYGRCSEKNLPSGPVPRSGGRALSCLVQTAGSHQENLIRRKVHLNFGRITLITVLKTDYRGRGNKMATVTNNLRGQDKGLAKAGTEAQQW